MAFTYVTVTHTFELATDVAAAGTVEFKLIVPIHNGTTTTPSTTITATLSGSGVMSQKLAANTDPDTTPAGTVYAVTERLSGQTPFTYFVQVPHDQGSSVSLADLTGWVGGGPSGLAGVTSVNTLTGDVVLTASDVGAQPADGDLTGLAALGDGVPVRAAGTWAVASGTPDGTKFLRDDGTWQSAAGSSYTAENARDDIAAALVAGPNVTILNDDTANTITISAAASGSSGIPASTVDAKGDLIAGTANDTVSRRSVGTNGQALLADSAQATGLAWGAPAPASHVHSAADVTSGTVATARLGSGTANSSTYLRGDQTYATPPTGTQVTVDGSPVTTFAVDSTAAVFNDLSDSGTLRTMLFGGSARTQRPFFAARLSADFSVANNTSTLIPNSALTIAKDTDSGWFTTNSNYTIPVNGFYRLTFFGVWNANATGTRFINITLNSTSDTTGSIGQHSGKPDATVSTHQVVHVADRALSAGDILRWYCFQDSGGSLSLRANYLGNVNTAFTVEWIRPT